MKRIVSFLLLIAILILQVGCSGETNDPTAPVLTPTEPVALTLQNETGIIDFKVSNMYFDGPLFFAELEKLIASAEANPELAVSDAYKHKLISLIRQMEGLGLYYDYIDKTFIEYGGEIYGAKADALPIGGGKNTDDLKAYKTNATYTVNDDATFFKAVNSAVAGDIIYIEENAVVDLSDFKITDTPYITVPEGVTVASSGDGNRGTIALSFVQDGILYLSKDAKLVGVALKGIDSVDHSGTTTYTKTSGVYVRGDNVVIENCEISGFSYAGIYVEEGSKNAKISHNFIHHVLGHKDGYAVYVDDGTADISYNLFSNVNYCVASAYLETNELTITNNVEVGNITGGFLFLRVGKVNSTVIEGEKNGPKKIVFKNNTMLSTEAPFEFKSIPASFEVTNNLFAMREETYKPEQMYGVEDVSLVYSTFSITNNVYNISNPFIESMSDTSFVPVSVPKIEVTASKAVDFTFEGTYIPTLLSNSFYGDASVTYDKLYDATLATKNSELTEKLEVARTALGEFMNYYEYLDLVCKEIDGEKYGAYADERGPIGGGYQYTEIFTTGDYIVKSASQLKNALSQVKSGQVIFIPGDCIINLDTLIKTGYTIIVPKGVTIASDRGLLREDGTISTGALFTATILTNNTYISLLEGSRFTGITLKGADPNRHESHHTRSFYVENAPGHDYYYRLTRTCGLQVDGKDVEIDNCEVSGFAWAGIHVNIGAKDAYIHHNYIHHNQLKGLGYGVMNNNNATSIIEYNLLNRHSHSIAGTGHDQCGYIARYNIEMGGTYAHTFDMHGGSDRGDGTNVAGTRIEIYNNTFLSPDNPYYLRGLPKEYQKFYNNVTLWTADKYNWNKMVGDRVEIYNNVFGINSNTVTEGIPT